MPALAMPEVNPAMLTHLSGFTEVLVMIGLPGLAPNGLLFDFLTGNG